MIETQNLPREMQRHTYAIMRRAEDSHWWYVGRRLILTSFVERIIQNLKCKTQNLKILDVGCGTGANLEMLAKFGDTTGVDVSEEALSLCKERGFENVRSASAESLPFDDENFDFVTALDVVEHLDDDVTGLKEMNRVLKKDGKALFFVPAFMFLWGVQDDVSHHRIRYTKRQIVDRIEESGFSVERATYANITFFAPILLGRALMKITKYRPSSENNITIGALNYPLGQLFGSERFWLENFNLPFGVSIVIVAKKL